MERVLRGGAARGRLTSACNPAPGGTASDRSPLVAVFLFSHKAATTCDRLGPTLGVTLRNLGGVAGLAAHAASWPGECGSPTGRRVWERETCWRGCCAAGPRFCRDPRTEKGGEGGRRGGGSGAVRSAAGGCPLASHHVAWGSPSGHHISPAGQRNDDRSTSHGFID